MLLCAQPCLIYLFVFIVSRALFIPGKSCPAREEGITSACLSFFISFLFFSLFPCLFSYCLCVRKNTMVVYSMWDVTIVSLVKTIQYITRDRQVWTSVEHREIKDHLIHIAHKYDKHFNIVLNNKVKTDTFICCYLLLCWSDTLFLSMLTVLGLLGL